MIDPEKQITIVIADDHPIFRQGLISVIENEKRYKIIAEASNGMEALELIEKLKPDMAIIDIDMPKMNGLEVVRKINTLQSACGGPTACVIITMYKDEEYFNEAMDLGVLGYLLKDGVLVELIECLETIQESKHFISPRISDYLISRNERMRALTKSHPSIDKLTKTEMQVLKHLSENKTSKRIAEEMFISEKTVENHRTNICTKLGLKGRNSLFLFALQFKSLLS